VGTVPSNGRTRSISNGPFLDSPQECIQHRQTHSGLSRKLLDVGSGDWNKWWKTSKTIFADHRISGAQVRLSTFSLTKSVPSTEKHNGETNCQDNAWCAVHVPFLSEKT
jgi:hypothetical protein